MDLENILYRIINGYYTISIDNTIYKITLPDISIKQKAHHIYIETIDEYKYDVSSWISEQVVENLLNIYGIWNDKLEDQLNDLIKDLDKTKIELYNNFFNTNAKESIKDIISKINIKINNLYNKKHHFDYLTLEYYTQNIKNQYLIVNMICDEVGKKIFDYKTFDNVDSLFLEKILSEIHKNTIDSSTIKKLARSDNWRSFWNVAKENIFPGTAKDWTDEQRSLINFSKVLDSIREHFEAPAEEIIADDDALDGWILHQNDKNDKEKKKKQISEKFGLDNKRGDEVFVMTQDRNEKKAIHGLNDTQTNRDIKQTIQMAQGDKTVDWTQLPHVQREIKQQVMKMKQGNKK